MPIQLIIFLAVIVLAVVVGGAALIAIAQRRAVLARAGVGDDGGRRPTIVLRPVQGQQAARAPRVGRWIRFPGRPTDDVGVAGEAGSGGVRHADCAGDVLLRSRRRRS